MIGSISKHVALWMGDPARRQRGSVLSGLLIVVAFLAILIGALMSELSTAFLISRVQATRVATEATVQSAAELGIHQLESSPVPPSCARDTSAVSSRAAGYVTLNGKSAAVTYACREKVPDVISRTESGAFGVEATYETAAGNYLVADDAGWLYSYSFGGTSRDWRIGLGGELTGPVLATPDLLLVPVANSTRRCGGSCVAMYDRSGSTPSHLCFMDTSATVQQRPATGARFPSYAFFGDSSGNVYVFDASSGSDACDRLEQRDVGSSIVGDVLVFPGGVTVDQDQTTTSDEIFVVSSSSSSAQLVHLRFSVTVGGGDGDGENQGNGVSTSLSVYSTTSLSVRSRVTGTALSAKKPVAGSPLQLVVSGSGGHLAIASISVGSGGSYPVSVDSTKSLGGGVRRAPYWCHCPQRDLIGVASTNGILYLLDPSLSTVWTYDSEPDGGPALITTPAVDANGDWYVGADDGYVYALEIPTSGSQMFKAARVGPGSPISSSPIVDSCGSGPCFYFGSEEAGMWFVKFGKTRVIDLNACVSVAFGSTACVDNPQLWTRVRVAPTDGDVDVIGWSYYSP